MMFWRSYFLPKLATVILFSNYWALGKLSRQVYNLGVIL